MSKGAEYQKRYAATEKGKATNRRHALTDKGKASAYSATNSWRQRNPEKARAHKAVHRAVRDGKLERATECERCRAVDAPIEASHDDYSKSLEVEWLCYSCHRRKDGFRDK